METWKTSSYSRVHVGNCVEVYEAPRAVLVRDTKYRDLGHIDVPVPAWCAFVAAVQADEL